MHNADGAAGLPASSGSVSLCVYDPQTQALQLRKPTTQAQPCFVLQLPEVAAAGDGGAAAAATTTLHLGASGVCVRARNILRVPLLELEMAGCDAECEIGGDGGTRATMNFSVEAWSYNPALKEWEAMLDRFPVRVRSPRKWCILWGGGGWFCDGARPLPHPAELPAHPPEQQHHRFEPQHLLPPT